MEFPITLTIILTKPTGNVVYGLQKGSGNNYGTVQKQMAGSNDLYFQFEVVVKGDRSKDRFPRLSGSFVQGPAANKFIYIDIGTYAGQTGTVWSRRLKIPLTGISWEQIDSLAGSKMLQAIVPGTGKDGGPNCATVKPFEGWDVTPA